MCNRRLHICNAPLVAIEPHSWYTFVRYGNRRVLKMTLGGRILEYRTARGMSQLALSEALGV